LSAFDIDQMRGAGRRYYLLRTPAPAAVRNPGKPLVFGALCDATALSAARVHRAVFCSSFRLFFRLFSS
jgi:hypothetical protein